MNAWLALNAIFVRLYQVCILRMDWNVDFVCCDIDRLDLSNLSSSLLTSMLMRKKKFGWEACCKYDNVL